MKVEARNETQMLTCSILLWSTCALTYIFKFVFGRDQNEFYESFMSICMLQDAPYPQPSGMFIHIVFLETIKCLNFPKKGYVHL